ncbi:MAG TPA: DNA-processing protein DprA [Acidimicrobiales bacterium]|jgi:DNA processing protein
MTLPPEAWAAALASLPLMGPARQLALMRRWSPVEAWEQVRERGWLRVAEVVETARPDPAGVASLWSSAASAIDVAALWQRYVDAGVGVAALGSPAYPAPLADDIEPPPTLFLRGDPSAISGPRVAIVGTRSASRYGIDVAYEFGKELSAAGVAVISGLALGIDGAAHSGALAAGTTAPIAVVGSGLDVIYPKRHAVLWREIERRGVVLGEAPLGAAPERWRFPARNRLIAALADILVVIESGEQGGSMHTVTEAERRGRPVFAVPGPVRSPSSAGTNRLLRDGAHAACDVSDVLVGLGMSSALRRELRDPRPAAAGDDLVVLDALAWQPASLEQLASRTGLALGDLSLALLRLREQGWVDERGGWYERVARAE